MPVLIERVCRTIDRYRLLPPGARVLVAASGGADSTALVWLLRELSSRLAFDLAGLAHFNHRLRGQEADADEAFCRDLAGRLNVTFVGGQGDVRAGAATFGTSIEDAARRLRYEFLCKAQATVSATRVAVGHTRDDQAETVLLHLLRGAGTRGLAGMPVSRDDIVRPLIECSHAELVAWLEENGRACRHDESNDDRRFARNRLRHAVMPVLERAFPGAAVALARSAELARVDAEYLDGVADERFASVVREQDGGFFVDVEAIGLLPRALASRVARLALSRASRRYIGSEHAAGLLQLACGPSPGRLLLPGLQADRVGSEIVIRPRSGRAALPEDEPEGPAGTSGRVLLSIPGEVPLGDGRSVSSDVRHDRPSEAELASTDGSTAVVDADSCSGLAVRYRRPGDRFSPLGVRGRKSLQDFFVDRKVPRRERGRVPLVVDGEDRIVWVAGHAVCADYRVTEATRAVVILKLRGERA
jgi:tRNA(Ile)-lysidine synthase